MILETQARYFGQNDCVQIAIVLQEDDGTSAADKLKTGTVELLHGNTAMFSEELTADHKVLFMDNDPNYGDPQDTGQFYFFIHHPAVQGNMNARVSVEMSDSRTASQKVEVDVQHGRNWNNPAVKGLDPVEFDRDAEFPYREQE